jgi:hypothetical protein
MYQVLGICLVVEHAGIVSLVLRYPATPPTTSPHRRGGAEAADLDGNGMEDGSNCCNHSNINNTLHLFFSLPSRVLAKLFRPKPPLCGRPLTIQMGEESLFCCHSVLLGDAGASTPSVVSSTTALSNSKHNNNISREIISSGSTIKEEMPTTTTIKPTPLSSAETRMRNNQNQSNQGGGEEEQVVMFSVVVALAPHEIIPRSIPKSGMCHDFQSLSGFYNHTNTNNSSRKKKKKKKVRAQSPPPSGMGASPVPGDLKAFTKTSPAGRRPAFKRGASIPLSIGRTNFSDEKKVSPSSKRKDTSSTKGARTQSPQANMSQSSVAHLHTQPRQNNARTSGNGTPSPSAAAADQTTMNDYHQQQHNVLQRVHRSLARVCRVLHKEEQRSHYVSKQTKFLLQIRDDVIMDSHQQPPQLLVPSGPGLGLGSPAAGSSLPSPPSHHLRGGDHSGGMAGYRNLDLSSSSHAAAAAAAGGSLSMMDHEEKDRLIDEHRQSTLESMLAACIDNNNEGAGTGTDSGLDKQKSAVPQDGAVDSRVNTNTRSMPLKVEGNLARDLAGVFHALAKHDIQSRNDDRGIASGVQEQPSPMTSHITIVHVNNHKAVPVEAVTTPSELLVSDVMLRFSNQVHHSLMPQHSYSSHLQLTSTTTTTTNLQQQKQQRQQMMMTMDQQSSRRVTRTSSCRNCIRPYHTLLFPKLSAEELLLNLKAKVAAAPLAGPPGPGAGKGTKRVGLRPGTSLRGFGGGSRNKKQHGSASNFVSISRHTHSCTDISGATGSAGHHHNNRGGGTASFTLHKNKGHSSKTLLPTAEKMKASPMYHVLSRVNYFKTLGDVAEEASMITSATSAGGRATGAVQSPRNMQDDSISQRVTLSSVLDVAARLVDSGICRLVPVISLKTRFATPTIDRSHNSGKRTFLDRMPSICFKFAKQFGTTVPLLAVVSIFSSGRPLGNVIHSVLNGGKTFERSTSSSGSSRIGVSTMSEDDMTSFGAYQLLLEQLSNSVCSRLDAYHANEFHHNDSTMTAPEHEELVREELCSMAVWLRANECLVEIKDYLVAVDPPNFAPQRRASKKENEARKEAAAKCDTDDDNNTDHYAVSPSQVLTESYIDPKKMYTPEDIWTASPDIATDNDFTVSTPPTKVRGGDVQGVVDRNSSVNKKGSRTPENDDTVTAERTAALADKNISPSEALYIVLRQAGSLNGHVSASALCWRHDIDACTLRNMIVWGRKNKRLDIVTRTHDCATDDRGAP